MSLLFDISKYKDETLIETGTYLGEGIKKALKVGFEKIYSIEIEKSHYDSACKNLKESIDNGSVELFLGSSDVMLEKILSKIDKPVTFWLDAHCGWRNTSKTECPLYKELYAIRDHKINTHTILVDDMRVIRKQSHDWASGLSEDGIIEIIKSINPDYEISYEDGLEPKDILVAKIK